MTIRKIIKKHYKTLLFWGVLGVFLGQFSTAIVHWVTPFEFNLDIKQSVYSDVCVGTTSQVIFTQRNVKPDGLKAEIDQVAWKHTGYSWQKTDITRSITVPYEKKKDAFSIIVNWDKPFTETGRYGVTTRYEIQPYGKYKENIVLYTDKQFNVIECNE